MRRSQLVHDDDAFRARVTQVDVAQRAGVSRALVSIVMRGARGASPETRERVLKAAQELGYRPDARARSLASPRSNVIGVMFGVSAGTFPFELLDGLFAAAEEHNHSLIMAPLTKTRDEERAAGALQRLPLRCADHVESADTASAVGRPDAAGGDRLAGRSSRCRHHPDRRTNRGSKRRSTTSSSSAIAVSPTSTAV